MKASLLVLAPPTDLLSAYQCLVAVQFYANTTPMAVP